ncbi:MAG: glycosyl hydrolase family 8 [Succinivibrio sp.]
MLKAFRKIIGGAALAASAIACSQAHAGAWDDYKAMYVKDNGAVVDTYNHNMSHSEGQSYGLLFALAYNDRDAFEKILAFAEGTLRNPENGLHYWAYKPEEADPTADKNNASDGDLMMAWALLKAGRAWSVKEYTSLGEEIAKSVADHCTVDFAGYKLLLPGTDGFYRNSSVIVNPSYLILPALRDIAAQTHAKVYEDLYNDGKRLLEAISKSGLKVNVVPDWVEIDAQGNIAPASDWPARSSYDAIRVPLYVAWDDPESPLLNVWRGWFGRYNDTNTPAWVNVTTGEVANYPQPEGLRAVRALALDMMLPEPAITDKDDYYNASLKILAFLASKRF